jgi:hypothetical protein
MAADMREELRRLNQLVVKWRIWADAMSHVRQANRVRECADDLERDLRQLADRADYSAGVGEKVSDDVRTAFFKGAKWWEFKSTGGTMWQSDQKLAWEEACKKYPDSALAQPDEPTPGDTKP